MTTLLATRAWLRPVSRGNRHFTIDGGRLRQSGPRPDERLLRQPALEGLTRSARTESPRRVGRNRFRQLKAARATALGGGGGLFREEGRLLCSSIGYPRMSASGESSTTMHRLLHASGSHPIPTPNDPKPKNLKISKLTKTGPISYIGPKTSWAARDRPELNPRRIQPSRHRRSIAGAAAAANKSRATQGSTRAHGRAHHHATNLCTQQHASSESGASSSTIVQQQAGHHRAAQQLARVAADHQRHRARPRARPSRGAALQISGRDARQALIQSCGDLVKRSLALATGCAGHGQRSRDMHGQRAGVARARARGDDDEAPPCAAAPWPLRCRFFSFRF
ncbi:hypothetical protein F511_35806 [Dorcoceras hygrometricum]|uniref:Uncharacterized protein n=1 Tax=Dorcoceras hygrometricum TaxID=472368 RepID=A0A2Z7CDC1_9LAMI|nr:hypothetical protein F511_35806 [Dorcoceras hygrometricum]